MISLTIPNKEKYDDPANGGNWFVDFKTGNKKYIVFRDKILKYRIGNQTEKDFVCDECRKMGILDEQIKEYFVNMVNKDMSLVKALFIPTAAIFPAAIAVLPECMND